MRRNCRPDDQEGFARRRSEASNAVAAVDGVAHGPSVSHSADGDAHFVGLQEGRSGAGAGQTNDVASTVERIGLAVSTWWCDGLADPRISPRAARDLSMASKPFPFRDPARRRLSTLTTPGSDGGFARMKTQRRRSRYALEGSRVLSARRSSSRAGKGRCDRPVRQQICGEAKTMSHVSDARTTRSGAAGAGETKEGVAPRSVVDGTCRFDVRGSGGQRVGIL